MKWIEHASEASELAVSDTRLAEAQARAIGQFFNVLRDTIRAGFGSDSSADERQRAVPATAPGSGVSGDAAGASPSATPPASTVSPAI